MEILTLSLIVGALIVGVISGFILAGSKINASAKKEKDNFKERRKRKC